MKKRILSMLLVIIMVLSLVPVSALAAGNLKITSSGALAYTLEKGQAIVLTLTGAEEGADIQWSSEKEDVAKPEPVAGNAAQCTVSGIGEGKLNIVATVNGTEVKYPLGVYERAADKPVIDVESFSMTLAEQKTLTYTKPAGTYAVELPRWQSSDTSVATIGLTDGKLTAKKAGTTDITVFVNGLWSDPITCTITDDPAGSISGEPVIVVGRDQTYTLTLENGHKDPAIIGWSFSSRNGAQATLTPNHTNCTVHAVDKGMGQLIARWGTQSVSFDLEIVPQEPLKIKDGAGNEVTALTLSGTESAVLTAVVPEVEDASDIVWSVTSGSDVINVERNGEELTVTGSKVGTASVTAKIKSYPDTAAAEVQITVNAKAGITDKIDTMLVGDTHTCGLLAELMDASAITWKSDNENVATVANGVVTAKAVGTAKISIVSGSTELDSFTVEVKAQPRIEIDPNMPLELLCGNALDLKAIVKDSNGSTVENVTVKWKHLDITDANDTTLSGSRLTAMPHPTKPFDVELQAYLDDPVLGSLTKDVTIKVIPRTVGMLLKRGTEDVTGKTSTLNLLDETAVTNGIRIDAKAQPEDAGKAVTWAVQDPDHICHYETFDTGLIVYPESPLKTGSVVIIATAKDGTGISAKTKVEFARLATNITILNAPGQLRGGETLKLHTSLETEQGLTNRDVKWTILEGKDVASINEDGELVTKPVTAPKSIRVQAEVKANPAATPDIKYISLRPAATSVTIKRVVDGSEIDMVSRIKFETGKQLLFKGIAAPAEAVQAFRWESSDESVVEFINADTGVAVMKGAGKVRITCTAADGSGMHNYIDFEVVKKAGEVLIEGVTELIAGDTSVMKATVYTDKYKTMKAGNQKVNWSVVGADGKTTSAASIDAKGRLVANNVKTSVVVTVVAKSAEDSTAFDEHTVTILPNQAKTFVAMMDDGTKETVLPGTLRLNKGVKVLIFGRWYDRETDTTEMEYNCTYFTSNSDVATIDRNGNLKTKGLGTTTITVRAVDKKTGDVFTDKFTLKVANLVGHVEIGNIKSTILRSGERLDLTATVWTNSGKTVKADNQAVTWKAYEYKDGKYVDAKVVEVSSNGRVTAKTVTENVTVRIYATSKEDSAFYDYVQLYIRPKENRTPVVFVKEGSKEYTTTRNVSMTGKGNPVVGLGAKIYDAAHRKYIYRTPSQITWSTSNSRIIKVNNKSAGNQLIFGGKTGSVKITAKITYGKNTYTDSIYLNVVQPATSLTVSQKDSSQVLYSGKTMLMIATVKPGNATVKRVKWSLADNEYATIDANTGLIHAKNVTSQQEIEVIAKALDGSGLSATLKVTIYPLATKVTIKDAGTEITTLKIAYGASKNLTAEITPNGTDGAKQDVKWSSSRSTIVSVDKNGKIKANRRGTTTITATAADGSGKNAKITVTVE